MGIVIARAVRVRRIRGVLTWLRRESVLHAQAVRRCNDENS
jgi:hypothetical protein